MLQSLDLHLEAQMRRKLIGRVHDFHLERASGGFVLVGEARSYYVKQLAQETLRKLTEEPIESNRISILQ